MRFIVLSVLFILNGFTFGQKQPNDVHSLLDTAKKTPIGEISLEKQQIKGAEVSYESDSPLLRVNKDSLSSFLTKTGTLIESKDNRIDLLIQDYTDNKKPMGYRVQLFAGNSKWEAVKVKSDFLKKYDGEATPHVIYQSPNFKVRVGDYKNRFEAQKFLLLYKVDYPSAFIVKDEIEIVFPD